MDPIGVLGENGETGEKVTVTESALEDVGGEEEGRQD